MTGRTVSQRVHQLVEPLLAGEGFELVDVELRGGSLRVTVDREAGIDLDGVSRASRLVSGALDSADPVDGGYTLEVSSPGVERPLRTPEHFRRFVGTPVSLRLRAGSEGDRRVSGTLEEADDGGVVVGGRPLAYELIERAHTVFVWPEPAGRGRR